MNPKTKLLIGILVVGILTVGGWWIWSHVQPVIDEKYCEQDSDCGWVSCCSYGYKCMRKDALSCPDPNYCLAYIEPVPHEPCVCINNRCTVQSGKEVMITTDKTEYEQGDTVKITVRNNLKESIWYPKHIYCGASFWLLETCEGEEVPYYEICLWVAPDYRFTKLNPTEILEEEWDGKIHDLREYKFRFAEPGCYRIVFPCSYSVNKKKLYEDWGEHKETIYSNEFTIKEKEVVIEGRIAAIGNEPFTQLAIETDEKIMYGIGGNIEELWKAQGKKVRLKGYFRGRTPRTEKSIEVTSFEIVE